MAPVGMSIITSVWLYLCGSTQFRHPITLLRRNITDFRSNSLQVRKIIRLKYLIIWVDDTFLREIVPSKAF